MEDGRRGSGETPKQLPAVWLHKLPTNASEVQRREKSGRRKESITVAVNEKLQPTYSGTAGKMTATPPTTCTVLFPAAFHLLVAHAPRALLPEGSVGQRSSAAS